MTRILFVTDVILSPPHAGHRIRCSAILRCLQQDYEVIVLAPTIPTLDRLYQDSLAWLNLRPPSRNTIFEKLANIIFTILQRSEQALLIKQACRQYAPQVVWYSFGHWGQYARISHQFHALSILDTHNIQSHLTWQEMLAKPWGSSKSASLLHFLAESLHEQFLFRNFDRITCVSEHDRCYHSRFVGNEKSILLPNFIDEQDYQINAPGSRDGSLIVMTGSFSDFQNRNGVLWFLQYCWPMIQDQIPHAHLQVIGRDSKHLVRLISNNNIVNKENISYVENVVHVAEYIQRASVAVVPILQGAGTRIKILEAMACCTPVVSTTLGASGLDLENGKHILMADAPGDFSNQIISLLNNPDLRFELAHNAYKLLVTNYTSRVNQVYIRRIIQDLIGN